MAAVAIPLIIHWWNNRQQKTLLVGSIAFLASDTKQRVQNRRIDEWLLLIVRCVMIILLSLLLAQPVWKKVAEANKEKGWVLAERNMLQQNYDQHKTLIDSLMQAGYTFRYFEPGFKQERWPDALQPSRDSVHNTVISYRTLFVAADRQAPTGVPLYIFTGNRLQQFTGVQPATARRVQWHTAVPADSVVTFIKQAYLTTTDSIRVITGNSDVHATSYTTQQLPRLPGATNNYHVGIQNGQLAVAVNNADYIPVDTTTLNITLFTDRYNSDLKYCKAALEAIQQFTQKRIRLVTVNTIAGIPQKQDWLFWLSEQPMPGKSGAANIFRYDTGKIADTQTWISFPGSNTAISLYKRAASVNTFAGNIVWKDGFGEPLLVAENRDAQQVYHFFSHFDPAWNDLPWSERFPALMLQLVLPAQNDRSAMYDRRGIAEQQVQVWQDTDHDAIEKEITPETTDLTKVCWLLLFVLFITERILSYAKQKRTGAER